jgi:hypothetical protein
MNSILALSSSSDGNGNKRSKVTIPLNGTDGVWYLSVGAMVTDDLKAPSLLSTGTYRAVPCFCFPEIFA